MQVVSQAGLDGVGLTARPKGHVRPEDVAQALPPVITAARKQGLSIEMMTTRINGEDNPMWDLWYLLHDLNPQFIGCEYDIRHAVAEGGAFVGR